MKVVPPEIFWQKEKLWCRQKARICGWIAFAFFVLLFVVRHSDVQDLQIGTVSLSTSILIADGVFVVLAVIFWIYETPREISVNQILRRILPAVFHSH